MHMRDPEVHLQSGLVVCRGAVDDYLVEQLDAEAAAMIELCVEPRDSSSKRSDGIVLSADFSVVSLVDFPATQSICEELVEDDTPEGTITVNEQAPYAFQRFHGDMKLFPVAVVHVSGDGALDYSLDPAVSVEETEGIEVIDTDLDIVNFKTISVLPGDVVIQMHPWKTHRGRNLGDSTRRALAIHR